MMERIVGWKSRRLSRIFFSLAFSRFFGLRVDNLKQIMESQFVTINNTIFEIRNIY